MNTHVEVFVHKKKKLIITCPHCKLEKELDVENIRNVDYRSANATCKRCMHAFSVSFNFRKYYRKSTSLSGFLFASTEAHESLAAITVTDVSLAGLGFTGDAPTVQENALLVVRFFLDDPSETEIEKEIIVEAVRDGHFGARFAGSNVFDTVLNKYILAK